MFSQYYLYFKKHKIGQQGMRRIRSVDVNKFVGLYRMCFRLSLI